MATNSFSSKTAGVSEIIATDINQFVNALTGAAQYPFAVFVNDSVDASVKLSEAAGARKFKVLDSAATEVWATDSDGEVYYRGTKITTSGILKHEFGGLEFNASAITTGGMIKGDSSGVMEILAKGAANTVLTMAADASDFSWAASVGALTHEGSQLTEASSNATSETDLISVTSLSIAAAKPILIRASIRKTSGTGDNYSYGLKLNSTGVVQAGGATGIATLATSSAQAGSTTIYIPPRSANYLRAVSAFGGSGNPTVPTYSADAPTADITSITLTYNGANSDTTCSCDDMHVFTVATS